MNTALLYHLALFLHVLGAFGLIAGFTVEAIGLRGLRQAARREDALASLRTMRLVQRIGPASVGTLLVTGLFMMASAWGPQGWIAVALAGLVLVALLGALLTGLRMARIGPAVGRAGEPLSGELQAALRDPLLTASLRLRLATVLGIAFLMTAKPSSLASLAVLGLAAGIGLLAGLATGSRRWATH